MLFTGARIVSSNIDDSVRYLLVACVANQLAYIIFCYDGVYPFWNTVSANPDIGC